MTRNDPDVHLFMTIPRIGYYIALLIKAEVGDLKRSKSGGHLTRYSGLAPSTLSSGVVEQHGRITRENPRWFKWAMLAFIKHYNSPQVRYHCD